MLYLCIRAYEFAHTLYDPKSFQNLRPLQRSKSSQNRQLIQPFNKGNHLPLWWI